MLIIDYNYDNKTVLVYCNIIIMSTIVFCTFVKQSFASIKTETSHSRDGVAYESISAENFSHNISIW